MPTLVDPKEDGRRTLRSCLERAPTFFLEIHLHAHVFERPIDLFKLKVTWSPTRNVYWKQRACVHQTRLRVKRKRLLPFLAQSLPCFFRKTFKSLRDPWRKVAFAAAWTNKPAARCQLENDGKRYPLTLALEVGGAHFAQKNEQFKFQLWKYHFTLLAAFMSSKNIWWIPSSRIPIPKQKNGGPLAIIPSRKRMMVLCCRSGRITSLSIGVTRRRKLPKHASRAGFGMVKDGLDHHKSL